VQTFKSAVCRPRRSTQSAQSTQRFFWEKLDSASSARSVLNVVNGRPEGLRYIEHEITLVCGLLSTTINAEHAKHAEDFWNN
jgi:hypothetical protein